MGNNIKPGYIAQSSSNILVTYVTSDKLLREKKKEVVSTLTIALS